MATFQNQEASDTNFSFPLKKKPQRIQQLRPPQAEAA